MMTPMWTYMCADSLAPHLVSLHTLVFLMIVKLLLLLLLLLLPPPPPSSSSQSTIWCTRLACMDHGALELPLAPWPGYGPAAVATLPGAFPARV